MSKNVPPSKQRELGPLLDLPNAELSPAQTLRIAAQLAAKIRRLHDSGTLHRSISVESVAVCGSTFDVSIETFSQKKFSFGGPGCDLETCPPELQQSSLLHIPAALRDARQLIDEAGLAFDPVRIDIYQLGALICYLLNGTTVTSYLQSPKTANSIPDDFRRLIDRALGYQADDCFMDLKDLQRELDELQQNYPVAASDMANSPESENAENRPQDKQDTKSRMGNDGLAPETDSILRRSAHSSGDELPFDRLGHYEIVGRIGHGGMGDVYQGYEKDLDRTVAIKVLPAEFARNDELVKRFYAEATAAAKLSHPNVIEIYFIGQDQGRHFFAMQYVEGESLSDLLHRRNRLEVEETVAIISQALSGLDAAHQVGLVHRDIKPGNLLIDQKHNRILLADFGLVKSMNSGSQMTATGMIMGTVDYISPEQGRGKEVDGRSDLYAIGVLMYQMLGGRLPFEAENPTAMIFQHVYESPKPLEEIVPEIPPSLVTIVNKLMSKSPDERYQNAGDVLTDIRASVAGQPLPSAADPKAEYQRSTIIEAPDFSDALPFSEATGLGHSGAEAGWWSRTQQRFLSLFRTHAPEFLQQLQTTEHQFDGAVAEYERRCERLQQLADEAEQVLALLQDQAKNYNQLMTDTQDRIDSAEGPDVAEQWIAEKLKHERTVVEIEGQIHDQQQQLDEIHSRLSQTKTTLVKLQTQRDLLSARLKMAHAKSQQSGGRKVSQGKKIWIYTAVGAAVACLLFVGVWLFGNWNRADRGKTPEVSERKSFTNSIGMTFHLIPSGKFLMGSPENEEGRYHHEQQHEVEITQDYFLGIHEVTQKQWKTVMGTQPWLAKAHVAKVHVTDGVKLGDDYPATFVNWIEAVEFCQKLSLRDGHNYRLPTEAEWERACRANTTTRYSFSDDDSKLGDYAWYYENTEAVNEKYAHQVGLKQPNSYGLHDMHGNLAEWCSDWFDDVHFGKQSTIDPKGPKTGSGRVVRGSGWDEKPPWLRSANRGQKPAIYRSNDIGFRVVRTKQPTGQSLFPFDLTDSALADQVKVRWASWGVNGSGPQVDMTSLVSNQIESYGYVRCNIQELLAVAGDPAVGKDKLLVVVLEFKGKVIRAGLMPQSYVEFFTPTINIFPHGSKKIWKDAEVARAKAMLSETSFKGTGVIWARWGNDGRQGGWGDAHAPVAKQISDQNWIKNSRNRLGIRSPSKWKKKTLRALLSLDSDPISCLLTMESYVMFDPAPEKLNPPVNLFTKLPTGPFVDIVKAAYGSGSETASCENEISKIILDRKATTEISTSGLGLKETTEQAGDKLQITYRVNDKEDNLAFDQGQRVNIYEEILKHAATKPDTKTVEKTVEKPTEQVLQFPGKFGWVKSGAAGRIVIFHVPEKEILVVVDLAQQKIVKEIAVEDSIVFAANRDKLVIAFPRLKQLQRWDLTTLERDAITELVGETTPTHAVMGSDSDGPLLLWGDGKAQPWDVVNMKPLKVNGGMLSGNKRFGYHLTASADGKTFCGWIVGLSNTSFYVMQINNGSAVVKKSGGMGDAARGAMPAADGAPLLGYAGGAYNDRDIKPISIGPSRSGHFIPTEDPRYILRVEIVDKAHLQTTICTTTDFTPIHTLGLFQGVNQSNDNISRFRIGSEPRVRFLPEHNLVACIPSSNDRLLIRQFDLESTLEQSGKDYFFVNSNPKQRVTVGENFSYQLSSLTNSAQVKYSLVNSPPGMTIDEKGLIQWPVKIRPQGGIANVVVEAKNDTGKIYRHAFALTVSDETTFYLPTKYDRMQMGGGGRYLIFHFRAEKKLKILDVTKQEFVKEIQVADNISFTAGRDKLLIAVPQTGQLERWDLKTFEKTASKAFDQSKPLQAIAMGSDGNGPLALAQNSQVQLWDVEKMEPLNIPPNQLLRGNPRYGFSMTVSADGKHFCGWTNSPSPSKNFVIMRIGENNSVSISQTDRVDGGEGFPSADGSLLIHNWGNVYTYDLKRAIAKQLPKGSRVMPTTDPRFVLAVKRPTMPDFEVTICSTADLESIYTLRVFPSVLGKNEYYPNWRCTQYLPHHNLVYCVPHTNDRVIIRPFELNKALDYSGKKYLHVISNPKPVAQVGETFNYQMSVLSSSDNVQYTLDVGPRGMKVSSKGLISWPIESQPTNRLTNVVVKLKNDDDVENTHQFEILVDPDRGSGDAAKPADKASEKPPAKNGDKKKKLNVNAMGKAAGSHLKGHTLLAFGYKNKVAEYDEKMNEIWSYECQEPMSAEKMANGNYLISEYKKNRVIEVTPEKKVVWEYPVSGPTSVRPLDNGNYLISAYRGPKALEVDRDGKTVWEHKTKFMTTDAIRLKNGNTLVAEYRSVAEVNPKGERIWKLPKDDKEGLSVMSVQELSNGNILMACMDGYVFEIERKTLKEVWRHKCSQPSDAYRLENGNTLIAGGDSFVEIDRDGKTVWSKSGNKYGTARR